jgi:hypothetical protein
MSGLPAATRDWLTGPGLTRLWQGARKRLESNGVQATGSLRLTAMNAQERNDLSLLLGKPLTGAAVTIRLDVLDARLRASAAGLGLRQTLEELGPPLVTGHLPARRPGMAPAVVRPAAPYRRSEGSDARSGDMDTPASGPSPHHSPRTRAGQYTRPRRTRRHGDRLRARPGRRHLARTSRPTRRRPRPRH